MKKVKWLSVAIGFSLLLTVSLSTFSYADPEIPVRYVEELAPGTVISRSEDGNCYFASKNGTDIKYSGSPDSMAFTRYEVSFGPSQPNDLAGNPMGKADEGWRELSGGYWQSIKIVENEYYPKPAVVVAPVVCEQKTPEPDVPVHVHEFVSGVIYDATCDMDGLEGTYCMTCGFVKESRPISAFGFTLEKYAQERMDIAKSGQNIVLEFGTLNSFPKSFMEKIAAKVAAGVSFEFRYMWNHELQKVKIPAGTVVDTNLDWYGPATMQQLYGAN